LDIKDRTIVAGSYTSDDVIEVFDMAQRERIASINWDKGGIRDDYKSLTMIYGCQFSKSSRGSMILAGGAGKNEVKLFSSSEPYKLISTIRDIGKSILSVDWANKSDRFVFGCSDGTVRLMEMLSDKEV
jgi:WD40 repeat protein